MAAHLHRHGLACRIIDRSPTPSDKSKALVLWGRSLEMLDDLGIVGDFLSAGMLLNAARIHGAGGSRSSKPRLLTRIHFDPVGTHYPRPLMLAQSETERLLTEHLSRVGVTVERPTELIDCTDHGDHVSATLRHAAGREETVRCDFLLGCDGAHSTVRKKLGLEFTGSAEPNDFILADCRIEGPIPHDELSLFWHSKGVLAFFPFARDRFRIIADMGTAQGTGHPPDPSLAQVQALVDERGPAGVRLSDPVWLAGFRINERKVAHYDRRGASDKPEPHAGRIFLAGDAAHIHSPAGGQGMNTGMQDAYNLVWKLALVQAGRARPTLLDCYSEERSAVGETVLRQAGQLTWVALLRNPAAQFLRNQLVWFLGHLPPFRRNFVRNLSEMAVHYPHSPLNGESSERRWRAGSIQPGDRMPDTLLRHATTNQEQRLLALLRGTQFDLLLLPASADNATLSGLGEIKSRVLATYPGLIRTHLIVTAAEWRPPSDGPSPPANEFSDVWLDSGGLVRKWLGARETALALVRPDGYLGYRGQPASWEQLRRYLEQYLIA